ncbi:MAG: response regulator [Planctomycetota bacterium]|jgi:DNA-binding NtrC family response regulator
MGSNRESILFVDDEENILLALRRLLFEEPYEVRTESNPKRALKEILRDPPTVVVADYQMPEIMGTDLLAQVKKINAGIVRMILTGKPDIQAVLAAVNEGEVYRFVLKPWDDDELRMLLRTACDYTRLYRERELLLGELEEQRETIKALEQASPAATGRNLPMGGKSFKVVTTDDSSD